MEAAGQLVVHTTLRHLRQRRCDDGGDALLTRAHIPIQQKIKRRGMGKLGRAAEATILLVEDGQRRLHHHADNPRRKFHAMSGEAFRIGQHIHGLVGRLQYFVAALAIGIGNRQQNLLEAGTSPLIDWRKVGAAVKRPAIGSQEDRERPTAGAGDGRDCKLVAAVDVGALVAIDLYGDEIRD